MMHTRAILIDLNIVTFQKYYSWCNVILYLLQVTYFHLMAIADDKTSQRKCCKLTLI
jgi:hypothetical protein